MSDYEASFRRVVLDERYLRNLDWGKPRSGHPEGTIRAHIEDLERNLASLEPRLTRDDVWKLKLLIHTHDTFKPDAAPGVPISDPRSHASLARAFLAEFCQDEDLLAMVQHHDVPYALWRQQRHSGSFDRRRLESILVGIRDWDLFAAFLILDGCTPGKGRAPLVWLFHELAPWRDLRFGASDLM